MYPKDKRLNFYLSADNIQRATEIKKKKCFICEKKNNKGLTVIILNLDKAELICPLLEDLIETKKKLEYNGINFNIVVGDTGTTDSLVLQFYNKYEKELFVERRMNYHFSKNNNNLFEKYSLYDNVLFLNNDVIFKKGSFEVLSKIYRKMQSDETVGIIGASLFYEDMKVQHIGVEFFSKGDFMGLCYHPQHKGKINKKIFLSPKKDFWEVSAVTGAFLCIRSELFVELQGFDEQYYVECQDVDLCLGVKKRGYHINLLLNDSLVHLENATRDKGSENWKDRQRFVRKWHSFVEVGI